MEKKTLSQDNMAAVIKYGILKKPQPVRQKQIKDCKRRTWQNSSEQNVFECGKKWRIKTFWYLTECLDYM